MRKEKQYHFIYKTTNIKNNKYYIGMHSTNKLDDNYLGSGKQLWNAINYHGKENFKREILEFCKSRKELKLREIEIVNLNEITKSECMNLRIGGSGSDTINYGITDEVRKKMSESHKGQIPWMTGKRHSKEARLKISNAGLGRVCKDETRKKMSESRKGYVVSKETRKRISESNIGNYHTEISKQKMSESHKGKILSEEHKQRISNATKNPSEETRYKQGSGKRGKTLSVETKKRIGESNSKPQKQIKCPNCNKVGGITNMKRYHYDNCKIKTH